MISAKIEGTNLPALSRAKEVVLTTGNFFFLRDQADALIEKNGIRTRGQLLGFILFMHSFGNTTLVKHLAASGIARGLFSKEDLVTLYKRQVPESRTRNGLITLTDIWEIPQLALSKERRAETLPMDWFSKGDIIRLAEETIDVNPVDLELLFGTWSYTGANGALSKSFLEYWYHKTGHPLGGDVDGKVAALIAIALHEAYPESVVLEGVLERFKNLSRSKPHSHGIFRYLSLAFWIAGKDKTKKQVVLDVWVENIIYMICSGRALFRGAQLSLEILIREKGISKRDKARALRKIRNVARDVAKDYHNLVKSAHDMVAAI